jgi:hypothetical protein
MRVLTVSFGQTCSCLQGDLALLDPSQGLVCLRHQRPLPTAHVAEKPREVFLRMAQVLVQRAVGDPHRDDVLAQRATDDADLGDVVLGTSIDLSWWHRWLEHLPLDADVEVHGRFLWYRAAGATGTYPLPMPPHSQDGRV